MGEVSISAEEPLSEAAGAMVAQATGLPAPVAKGLLGAVYRLLGGAVAYPAAWFQRAVQGVEDGTAARTYLHGELTKAAAQQAVADPRIVDRAMWSLLGEGVRKQVNREAVAKAAVAETARQAELRNLSETSEPDADWMNIFTRYAEDASSERLQLLWGQVLSGEIRQNGSFSLSTLRFLAELDKETASLFEKFAEGVLGDFAPRIGTSFVGDEFYLLNTLEICGLITGLDGNRVKICTLDEHGKSHLIAGNHALLFEGIPNASFRPQVFLLTEVGKQILSILPDNDFQAVLNKWIPHIAKDPLKKVSFAPVSIDGNTATYTSKPIVVWSA